MSRGDARVKIPKRLRALIAGKAVRPELGFLGSDCLNVVQLDVGLAKLP